MADYFRSAARCDRRVAAKAPVPIYDSAADRPEAEEESVAPPESVERTTITSLSGLQRVRAELDQQSMADIRLRIQRDARILQKNAIREERALQRAEEIARRNATLIEHLRAEREASKSAADATTDASLPAVDRVLHEPPAIELFERLRLEEEREARVKHSSGGGIAALYNEIVLDTLLAKREDESGVTQFPSRVIQRQFGALVPADPKGLVSEGRGRSHVQKCVERADERKQAHALSLNSLRQIEEEERVAAATRAQLNDHERSTMLMELVAQDNERMRVAREDATLKQQQDSALSPYSSFLSLRQRGSPHPIDAYRELIREDIAKELLQHRSTVESRASQKLAQ